MFESEYLSVIVTKLLCSMSGYEKDFELTLRQAVSVSSPSLQSIAFWAQ